MKQNSSAQSGLEHHLSASLAVVAFVWMMLTVCASLSSAIAEDLDAPLHVRFSLADGADVTGQMTSWDHDGFDGTFGRRAWTDLAADDLWRVYRVVMNSNDADQWINIGRLLLLVEDGANNAERAFNRALRLDESAQLRIDEARAAANAELHKRERKQQRAHEQKLKTQHPETAEYSTDPWAALTDDQQRLHTDDMRSRAEAILERAGIDASLIETNWFLLYSQMPHAEALRWGRLLDRCYEEMAVAVGGDQTRNIFWGKAVVLVHDDADRFRVTEADVFNHLSPRSVQGHMHPDGPRVFLNLHRPDDDVEFGQLLCRLATYAFLHRHITPKRLPAWAADGLALYATQRAFDLSTVEQVSRPFALKFIRNHPNDVPKLLTLGYDDEQWPGPDNVGPAGGYLLVEMLRRENTRAFARWVQQVKLGEDWTIALREAYDTPTKTIVTRFVGWYRVNN